MSQHNSSENPTWFQLVIRGWEHWIHIFYIVLLIAIYYGTGVYEAKDIRVLLAYIAVLVYVILLTGFLAYFIISYSRKARYSEAMYCLHSAVHELRNTCFYLDRCLDNPLKYQPTKFEESLRAAIDSVVQAFGIVSSVSNRACIKILGGTNGNEYVTTLCRDSASQMRNKERDESEAESHKVDKNTDFHLIVRGEERYFLCNNLKKYPNYKNTSLDNKNINVSKWPLPYVSSLVLPIRCIVNKSNDISTDKDTHIIILGFLAIDSKARGAYTERYDVEMGAIVADTLFSVLDRWVKVENAAKHAHAQLNLPKPN